MKAEKELLLRRGPSQSIDQNSQRRQQDMGQVPTHHTQLTSADARPVVCYVVVVATLFQDPDFSGALGESRITMRSRDDAWETINISRRTGRLVGELKE
jgi:hypothetical protein